MSKLAEVPPDARGISWKEYQQLMLADIFACGPAQRKKLQADVDADRAEKQRAHTAKVEKKRKLSA